MGLQLVLRNILFLMLVFPMWGQAQQLCSTDPDRFDVTENNDVGLVVTTIQKLNPGVTLEFIDPPTDNPFLLQGDQIILVKSLDYEAGDNYIMKIKCADTDPAFNLEIRVIVIVLNVNDEGPTFSQNSYNLNVKEFTPVNDVVGTYDATDKDSTSLYYKLIVEPDVGFGLESLNNGRIVVKSLLDYDVIKSVTLTLYAQDTAPEVLPSFTASTTIMVTITDDDNRPPWFQPCDVISVGPSKICQTYGYTGSVSLTEQQADALTLEPGPLYAVDGDNGINTAMVYSILNGNAGNLFQVDANSGNITMTKAADVPGPIVLSVMAAQIVNSFQFATTTVTIQVVNKSLHEPVFEGAPYSGVVSGLGSMVFKSTDNTPLIIKATDEDFLGGENPYIVYSIIGISNFSIIGHNLFLMKDSPLGGVSLQVKARDTAVGDVITAEVQVEVTSGQPTTTLAPTTSSEPQTDSSTTSIPTSSPPGSTLDSITTDGSMTTQGSDSTASSTPSQPAAGGAGRYGASDMAALGATLAVLLFISLGIIGYLVYRVQHGKAAWGKLSEASVFRSSLGRGPGVPNDGVQYTNEAFKKDEDSDSTGQASPAELRRKLSAETVSTMARNTAATEETVMKSAATLLAMLPEEEGSTSEMDGVDGEKEVKPILTKERRTEEGYKSVWFKQDIVPDAKEDVHIIPDNTEQDAEEDDEASTSSGNEEDSTPGRKVMFGDVNLDSGLEVKASDSGSDSENNEILTSDL
ncbi:cadherin-related family member 5 isoform X1 [Gadus morhua]|uniref:Cadherin-related family member 5-like n=1 Tax=Gadus morhua TaxID=8049 RepID=A0A8C4YY06_GADMO|nr:cadherin-related family member 5-like isoform X1 [Gadus morhua]